MQNNEDRKWLYDNLSKQGYQIGTQEEFEKSLDENDEDAKWYHDKATKMGLQVGDYNEFESLFRNKQKPSTPTQEITPAKNDVTANDKQEYISTSKEAWKQGFQQLGAQTKYAGAEILDLLTNTARDNALALEAFDELQSEGKDIVSETRRGAIDESKVNDKATDRTIRKVLDEVGGDVEAARTLLAKRAQEKTTADEWRDEASEVMNNAKPTKGFGAWVGNMIPQMIAPATGVVLSAVTGNPLPAVALGLGNIGVLTASTAGASMKEARDAGATNGEVWATGLTDAAIELATEAIPFKGYISPLVKQAKSKAAKVMADAVMDKKSPARKEMQDLLTRANEQLGGKLFTAENVAKYLDDIMKEGASEFAAEALQTITPMIYAEPEKYPTFWEVFSNGLEGLKGGIFMGGVLGGLSQTATNKVQRDRRKKQGFVEVAEVKFDDKTTDIVEVINYNADTDKADVLLNGEIVPVENASTKFLDHQTFSFEEFDRGQIDMEQEESYENGRNIATPEEKNDAKMNLDVAAEEMRRVFGLNTDEDIDEYIGNDIYGFVQQKRDENPDDGQVVLNYINAKAEMDGLYDRINDDIDAEVEQSNRIIDSRKSNDDGMIHPATLSVNDRKVYIISGNVAKLDDGKTVDTANSSESIIVMDAETGKREFVTAKDFREVTDAIDAEQEKANAAELIANTISEREEKEIDGTLAFAPNDVYTILDNEGAEHNIVVVGDNGDGTINAIVDGNEKPQVMAKADVQAMSDNAKKARKTAEIEAKRASNKVVESSRNETVTEPTANVEQAPERVVPKLQNGQPDFNAMDADMFVQEYASRYGEESTAKLARKNIDAARNGLLNINKKIDDNTDPNKMQELHDKRKELEARLNRYTDILDRMGMSEDANETEAEQKSKLRNESGNKIVSLFPDGLPNVESFILADIATGNRIRWSDKETNGAVTSRGLGAELGLSDSNSERVKRLALISNEAMTPEEYAESLRERLDAAGIRYDESSLRDDVLNVYQSVDTRKGAWEALENIANRANEQEQEIRDWEDAQQRIAYEKAKNAVELPAVPDLATIEEEVPVETDVSFDENINEIENIFNDERSTENTDVPTSVSAEDGIADGNQTGVEMVQGAGTDNTLGDRGSIEAGQGSNEGDERVRPETISSTDVYRGAEVDNQGNPINLDGSLKLEKVESIDDMTDEDFENPYRNIELPTLPENVADAIGSKGKSVVIKKNIFERNIIRHSDLTPDQSRDILKSALYSPNLYGQNQKKRKPYNWVVVSTKDANGQNKLVLLEISDRKNNIEIVHWHYVDARGLEKLKRQAEREDGQLLILPSESTEEVGALSDPTLSMPSESKDTTSEPQKQAIEQKNDDHRIVFDAFGKDYISQDGKNSFRITQIDGVKRVANVNVNTEAVVADNLEMTFEEVANLFRNGQWTEATSTPQQVEGVDIVTIKKDKHTKTGEDLFVAKIKDRVSRDEYNRIKGVAKEHNGYYSTAKRGFIFKTESDAEAFRVATQVPSAQMATSKSWDNMTANERMDYAMNNPITIEDVEKSFSDDVNKSNAIAYIRGTNTLITQLSYLKIYEDVRIRPSNIAPNNGGADRTQLAQTNDGESANGRAGRGGGSAALSVGENRSTKDAGNSNSREDSSREPDLFSGTQSNREVSLEEPAMVGIPATGGYTRGGGSNRSNGGNGQRRGRVNGGKNISTDAERTSSTDSLDAELDAALERFKKTLSDFKSAGSDTLNLNIAGLNSRQLEILPNLISEGTKVGYILVKKGIQQINQWVQSMRSYIAMPLSDAGLSDAEIDAFIMELWNSRLPIGDEVHTISEWASIIGMEATRDAVKSVIIDKKAEQDAAENIKVVVGDANNIAETLPFLLPQQQEDVLKAEMQFFDNTHADREHAYGKGYMFTNGTGTGKTYTGLGIVKRFIKQGKKRILIVTPSQQKVTDWIGDAKNLNINLRSLDDFAKEAGTTATQTSGEGAVITTYANFRENRALLEDVFDLVVYDESHRLLENKQGISTQGAQQHYMLTNRDANYAFMRLREVSPIYSRLQSAQENFIAAYEKEIEYKSRKNVPKLQTPLDEDYKRDYPKLYKAKEAFNKAESAWVKEETKLKKQAEKDAKTTKVVFLSATPFNSRDNLDYVERYIFMYPEENMDTIGSYKHQSPKTRFYLDHFGGAYKFRYGRLENAPQNADVISRQEIAFSDYLQNNLKTMSGRVIDSEFDYSRDFPTVSLDMGDRINAAIGSITEDEDLRPLWSARNKVWFNYNYSSALFETMKISAMLPRLREHLDMGRKIVIFHRRIEAKEPITPPFRLMMSIAQKELNESQNAKDREKLSKAIDKFKKEYSDLFDWEKTLDYRMPREQLADVFGKDNVLFFSGKESAKVKNDAVKKFNDDNSGKNIIVIQEASGKEGISLHDRTGKHQRVVVTLALPQSPITALQIEGRIYRIGNKSNAIFEYPILGLNSEIVLFGQNFNKSVSTTENLALGSQARNLRDSFARGIEERSGNISVADQGVGGKASDANLITENTPFDNAVLDYYTNQKITAKRDNRDGIDYYPTPEPLGFMMNQWGRIKDNDDILEPSAGHGAIARYVPMENSLTAVEPSQNLFARLQIKVGGAAGRDFVNDIFENYNIANKHDVILMNPPFGVAGKLASEHVAKAYKHLGEGGRIVAIVPEGKAQDRINKWLEAQKDAVVVGEVLLPDITFTQAGTNIRCRVLVIDKITNEAKRNTAGTRKVIHDLNGAKTIDEFFGLLQDVDMPDRTIDTQLIMQKKAKRYASDLRSIKGVQEVIVNPDNIIVRSKGWRRFYISWGNATGDTLMLSFAKQYQTFANQIPYSDETSQEIMKESQSIICKLASMTEDEMERYVNRMQDNNADYRDRVVSYEQQFADLQSEYDALDKEDVEALNEWREKKTGILQSYMNDVTEEFNLPVKESYVYDPTNEDDIKRIYDAYVAALDRRGITSPIAPYEEFKAELQELDVAYQEDADIIVANRNSMENSEQDVFDAIMHEQTHGVVSRIISTRALRDVWEEGKANLPKAAGMIEEKYKGEGEVVWGNEFLTYYLVRTLFSPRVRLKSEAYIKGESKITAEKFVKHTQDLLPLTNDAVKQILNFYKDEYQKKTIHRFRSESSRDGEEVRGGIRRGTASNTGAERGGAERGIRGRVLESANALAASLGVKLNVVDAIPNAPKGVKGRYSISTDQVYFVLPNATSVEDAKRTVLHEVVAHKGLRDVVGRERFNKFLDKVFQATTLDVRSKIIELAKNNSWNVRVATEEYLASLAEKGFDGRENRTFWEKVRDLFMDMLREAKIILGFNINDNDMLYMLWRTYQMQRSNGIMAVAEDVVMQRKLGVGNYRNRSMTEREQIIADAKANGTYLKAPNGKDTNLTPEQWVTVRTDAFKKWFGDWENDLANASKVVDANGEPKVVYNGSKVQHYNYDGRLRTKGQSATNSKVSFFTDNKDVAERYGKFVNEVFLNIRNPYEIDYNGAGWQGWSGAVDGMQRASTDSYADLLANGSVDSTLERIIENYGRAEADYLASGRVRNEGVAPDGVIAYEVADPIRSTLYIVRNAEAKDISRNSVTPKGVETFTNLGKSSLLFDSQIKSATGNVGTFDPSNDDIRFRVAPSTPSTGVARKEYDKAVRIKDKDNNVKKTENFLHRFLEGYQDSMISVKKLMDAVLKETGNKLRGSDDVYTAENHLSSKNKAEIEKWERDFMKPLQQEIFNLINKGASYDDIVKYLLAKSGLERNDIFTIRDAQDITEKWEKRRLDGAKRAFDYEKNKVIRSFAGKKAYLSKSLGTGAITQDDYDKQIASLEKQEGRKLVSLENKYNRLVRKIQGDKSDTFGRVWNKIRGTDFSGLTELTGEAKHFTEAAQQIVEEFEGKYNTTNLWSKINAATKEALRKSYESSLMNKETYDKVSNMFKYYIPLRGWDSNVASDEYEYMANKGMKILPALKTAKGRKSRADDPIATLGSMGESSIIQGNRNQMKLKFLNFALSNPTSLLTVSEQWYEQNADGTWRPSNPEIPEEASADEVDALIKEHEAKMEALGDKATKKRQGLNLNLHATRFEQEEHAVNVKRNGKEYKIFVNGNPIAAQAINGFTNPNANKKDSWEWIEQRATAVRNFMARAFTSMNPAFIFTNLARDLVWAGTSVAIKENASYTRLYSKNISKAMTTAQLPRLVSKWKKGTLDMNNPIEKYFHEFVTNGGETGFTQLNTVDDYKRNMERFIKEAQGGTTTNIKKAWRWVGNNVEFLNRSAEDTTRFMVYLTSRQMGRPIIESVANAKDITVNFNKKGRGTMGANVLGFAYIFFNATIQSLANFGKLIANHPKKTATALTVFGASGMIAPMTALALQAMLSGDDDEPTYWDLPEWVRRNNIVLYVGGSGYITIPLPHELRPFYGMGELALSVLMGKEEPDDALKKAVAGFASLMPLDFTGNGGNVAVNFTPTIAQPVAQLIANKDYFGVPIYRRTDYNKLNPGWTKAYKSTNRLLVDATEWLNEATGGDKYKRGIININPAIVEHLFEGYFGGMAKTINRTAKTFSMLWDEDAREWRNVPILSSFYQKSDDRTSGSQVNREYFDAVDEADAIEHLYSGYNKEAKMGSIEYAEKLNELINSDVFKRYQKVNSYKKAITKLNEALKQADPTDREQIETRIMEMKVDMLEELEKLELNNK